MGPFHCLLCFALIHTAVTQLPLYQYMKELCPPGFIVATTEFGAIQCNDNCPTEAVCHKGVCCTNIEGAICHSTIFRYSTKVACIPTESASCPPGTHCSQTTSPFLHLCCSESPQLNICPGHYPIPLPIDGGLALCGSETTCHKGLCVSYGRSSMSICCQNNENLCGTGSHVELIGSVPRTCSRQSPLCSPGFVCTASRISEGICCSLATCPNGKRAKRRCNRGCSRRQRCTKIGKARWCCDIQSICNSGTNRGNQACRTESDCASGFTCKKHVKGFDGSRCCIMKPRCPNGTNALIRHGKIIQCFIHGSPCMTAGYSCQRVTDGSLQCCSILPLLAECPQGYRGAMSLISGGIIPCSDRFDFTCPPGYSCLPSDISEQHLCCTPESSQISIWNV